MSKRSVLLLFLAVHFFRACVAEFFSISRDESALLAFKANIIYDPDRILEKNWTQGTSFCNWIGITCGHRHQRVTVLNLCSKGLIGTIAAEVGNLSFLLSLDIGNNNFHGHIPDELGRLRRLRGLYMQLNELSGQIPKSFGFLTRIQELVLYNNSLSGPIPSAIFNFSSVQTIDLKFNLLEGTIPMDICRNLPKLEMLNVSQNQLEGHLPASLSQCPEIRFLALSFNKFTGSIPGNIGNLSKLQELYLGRNNLTGELPITIFNISSLRILSAHQNMISGSLPMDICKQNSRIQTLILYNNFLQGQLPSSLSHCSELYYISLGVNNYTGSFPAEIGNMSALQYLFINFNSLTGALPFSLFNFSSLSQVSMAFNKFSASLPQDLCHRHPKLELIHLHYNQIYGQVPSSLWDCSAITNINLAYNRFTGNVLDGIRNVSMLQKLVLQGNNFTGIIPSSIGNISSLVSIILGENTFHGNIPPELGNLSNLELFYVHSNNMTGEIPQSIFNISVLQIITLSDNQLSGNLPPVWPTNLQGIFSHTNRITGTIPSSIKNASQLSLIDLTENLLSGPISLAILSLSQSKYLFLADNQFTNDPSMHELGFVYSLANCRQLKHLEIGTNPLNGIFPKSLWLGNLSLTVEKFDAENSGLKGAIPSWMGNFSSLLMLNMESNELAGSIPDTFAHLRKLQSLALKNNKITGPIPHSVCKMEALFQLSLGLNQLSSSLPRCLGNLSSLRELYLFSNDFISSIPSTLWSNNDMSILDLSNNSLNGSLSPEIGSMKGMRVLNLSGNQFSGEIPSTVQQLQNLALLSLSKNNLYGFIPDSFGNLISLEHLDLSQNNFFGSIPQSLKKLQHLVYLNVSFNRFRGEIPDGGCFANLTAESFKGNSALCGASRFKVRACKTKKLPLNKSSYLKHVLPPVILILLVASLFCIWILRCKNRGKHVPAEGNSLSEVRRISYYEILHATNNFDESNLIGKGSLSSVFKGILSDGMAIAVKVFNVEIQGALKSFDSECQVFSNIRHRNLVKVISSCSNPDFKALVLDYMPNGNLDKWLYSYNYCLNVLQRLGIMMDVACAMMYLHQEHLFPVVHCDLKPSNILLDNDMVARVCDFGIAKLLSSDQSTAQTKTLGTIGYMAPEYGSAGIVSPKGDVYSYGILLMETFTRKKPTDDMFQGEQTMKTWVFNSFPDAIMEIVDVNLLTEDEENVNAKVSFFTSIMGLALECTSDLIEDRIDMKDVVMRLHNIKTQLQSNESRG